MFGVDWYSSSGHPSPNSDPFLKIPIRFPIVSIASEMDLKLQLPRVRATAADESGSGNEKGLAGDPK